MMNCKYCGHTMAEQPINVHLDYLPEHNDSSFKCEHCGASLFKTTYEKSSGWPADEKWTEPPTPPIALPIANGEDVSVGDMFRKGSLKADE